MHGLLKAQSAKSPIALFRSFTSKLGRGFMLFRILRTGTLLGNPGTHIARRWQFTFITHSMGA
jgi:hypothetical protein